MAGSVPAGVTVTGPAAASVQPVASFPAPATRQRSLAVTLVAVPFGGPPAMTRTLPEEAVPAAGADSDAAPHPNPDTACAESVNDRDTPVTLISW